LEDELLQVASLYFSELGGGAHRHAGLLLSAVDYKAMAPGAPFIVPANPGVYPEDFLLELRAQQTGYLNVTPFQMMTHLQTRWGALDFVDIPMLMAKCNSAWSLAKIPTKYFNCIDKARRQLAHANVQIDEQAMMLKALKCFKDAGNYNVPVQEWEARPAATQTYANLKMMMSTKYSKINCQDAATARAKGHTLVNNVVKEFAQAAEEVVAEITGKHSKLRHSSRQTIKQWQNSPLFSSRAKRCSTCRASISHSKSIHRGLQEIEMLEREVSNRNNLSALQQDPSQLYPQLVLGIGDQCPQADCRMEIGTEHLTRRRAVSNNRVAFNG
jgi:hypothetical protein